MAAISGRMVVGFLLLGEKGRAGYQIQLPSILVFSHGAYFQTKKLLIIAGIKLGPNKKHEDIKQDIEILKPLPQSVEMGPLLAPHSTVAQEHLRSPATPEQVRRSARSKGGWRCRAPFHGRQFHGSPSPCATLLDLAGMNRSIELPSVWVAPSAPSASGSWALGTQRRVHPRVVSQARRKR